jgi:hypothetical protein
MVSLKVLVIVVAFAMVAQSQIICANVQKAVSNIDSRNCLC